MPAITIYENHTYLVISDYSTVFYECVDHLGQLRLLKKNKCNLKCLSEVQKFPNGAKFVEISVKLSAHRRIPELKSLTTPIVFTGASSSGAKRPKRSASKKRLKKRNKHSFDEDRALGIGMTRKPGCLIMRGFR